MGGESALAGVEVEKRVCELLFRSRASTAYCNASFFFAEKDSKRSVALGGRCWSMVACMNFWMYAPLRCCYKTSIGAILRCTPEVNEPRCVDWICGCCSHWADSASVTAKPIPEDVIR